MKRNLSFSIFFLFCIFSLEVFAQDVVGDFTVETSGKSSVLLKANRKTALRLLKLSESYLSSADYLNALSKAELGLSYDSEIADLWYVMASAKMGLGSTRSEVLSLVTKSLTQGEWVDYNRDGARILYADLLCDTGRYSQAIGTLDSEPFIYSSDAEFIRSKAYYRMRTDESVSKARDKINAARRIYPLDKRFPTLFFKYEYDFLRSQSFLNDEDENLLVKKIAESFVSKMPEYDNPNAELEIYSVYFAPLEKQTRLAQAFSSHGLKHPLYAVIALKCGLMTEQEAWDYFCTFADEAVFQNSLYDMLLLITDSTVIESVKEHLNAFSGTLTFDTDFDLEPNLFVKYERGRPSNFLWDKENDGIVEWKCECDFGVPESLFLTQGNVNLYYENFPSIIKAVFESEKIAAGEAVFTLPAESFEWSPFSVVQDEFIFNRFDFSFYVPQVLFDVKDLDESLLLKNCSGYEIASNERPGARIYFSVLDGVPQTAEYKVNDKVYAKAQFANGFPEFRSVDNNDDGIFETVETFALDSENSMHRTKEEQEQVMTNLFGKAVSDSGLYLKMIQIDSNADTIPDFSEEYLAFGGKISSWDFDSDSKWDLRYKLYPKEDSSSPLIEDAQFYTSPERKIVTVTLWNHIPVKVEYEKQFFPVTQGASDSFYWVGQEGDAEDEKFVLENFSSTTEQGKCVLLESKKSRIQVVKIDKNIFAEIISAYDESLYGKENE